MSVYRPNFSVLKSRVRTVLNRQGATCELRPDTSWVDWGGPTDHPHGSIWLVAYAFSNNGRIQSVGNEKIVTLLHWDGAKRNFFGIMKNFSRTVAHHSIDIFRWPNVWSFWGKNFSDDAAWRKKIFAEKWPNYMIFCGKSFFLQR